MSKAETLIFFRHGVYDRNRRVDSIGETDKEKAQPHDPNDDYVLDLLPEGRQQAERVREMIGKLSLGAISACLTSPYLRTRSTADIVFEDTDTPIIPIDTLQERNLADFTDLSRQAFHEKHKKSARRKKKSPLDWLPKGKGAETLRMVGDRAIQAVDIAGIIAPDGIVALSTSADVMVSLRSRPELGGLVTNRKIRRLLCPEVPNPQWIQNGQLDIYSRKHPYKNKSVDDYRYFRSIAVAGSEFDTGWLQLREETRYTWL